MRGNGSATIVALGLVGFVMTTNPALSQLECNPRAGYPPVLYDTSISRACSGSRLIRPICKTEPRCNDISCLQKSGVA